MCDRWGRLVNRVGPAVWVSPDSPPPRNRCSATQNMPNRNHQRNDNQHSASALSPGPARYESGRPQRSQAPMMPNARPYEDHLTEVLDHGWSPESPPDVGSFTQAVVHQSRTAKSRSGTTSSGFETETANHQLQESPRERIRTLQRQGTHQRSTTYFSIVICWRNEPSLFLVDVTWPRAPR